MKKNYEMLEWTDENVEKFWNYQSNFKEEYFSYQVGDKVINYLSGYLKGKKNLLDFGCGVGFLVENILNLNLNIDIYGLDSSGESIKKVNEKFQSNQKFKGAYTMRHFKDSPLKFDCIIATEVVEHLDDIKLNSVMNFIKTLLSEDGIVILTTPNDEDLSKSMVYCPESNRVFHKRQHVRSWSEDTLKNFLLGYFSEVNILTTNFSQTMTFKQKIKNRIKKLIKRHQAEKLPHMIAIACR